MRGKVSVVIPVYNEEYFLDECVNSIIHQTYKDLEIILVDDGSKQSVADACDEYVKIDKRISVIHNENQGLSAARLCGYSKSSGQWIMFVDDDDILPANAIELLYYGISCEDVDIVSGRRADLIDVKSVDDVSESMIEYNKYTGREICNNLGKDDQKNITTPLWGKLYRKTFLEQQNLYAYKPECPTIFFEDVLMMPILYAKSRKVVLVNQLVYIHREVPTSISRSGQLSKFYYEQIESGNILLQFCKTNKLKNLYAYELKIYFGSILRIWCLIDREKIPFKQKDTYKEKICEYYRKYIVDYLFKSSDKLYNKLFFSLFALQKKMWGKIVYQLYFAKKN